MTQTHLSQLMDIALLREMVESKMVTCKADRSGTMFILNYTPQAQYSGTWNHVTRQCRGLIVLGDPWTSNPQVVARPFQKFFNVGEYGNEKLGDLPPEPFDVFTKMDGSLGILYTDALGMPAVATRGSFSSEQALWATKFYRIHYGDPPPPGVTLLFEIIYPENRVVVDYGRREDLVLLAAIDISTGADVDGPRLAWRGSIVESKGVSDNVPHLVDVSAHAGNGANEEGFVLRYRRPGQPSIRAKVKYSEYVRLHRLVTGVTAKTIWELLAEGKTLDELLTRVPDEFFDWVKLKMEELRYDYWRIEAEAFDILARRPSTHDRKANALYFADKPHKAVLFRMLDGRDYSDIIWKQIKPAHERPFKVDADA